MAMRLQLTSGLQVLEEWAINAPQADRNVIYEALFAVADGSAFLIYDIFGDGRDPHQFIILVKHDLVIRIGLKRADSSFEIVYIGALEHGTPAAAWAEDSDGS
ncbi:DUF6235 family protein [Amycolatopsis thailandensis]|uniref:Addiction module toxin RelE n=1 Tax=Amycolatopsis thailandensis TaxID=589330 RepID=A0A229SF30_9PSEU|nr:DUF6235 family protein [Amycolatopsis thailandensis]OXM57528.1 hypothetical protein CFP71_07455 [Amycolatopsis thailandensis]